MSTLLKGLGALLLPALTLAFFLATPELHAQYKKQLIKNWINWNGVFRKEVDSVKQGIILNQMKSEIAALSPKSIDGVIPVKGKLTSYLRKESKRKKLNPNAIVIKRIVVKYCSNNDPLLWNISVDAEFSRTDTADGSTITAPPPKPTTRPAGDPLARLDQNKMISMHLDRINVIVPDSVLMFPSSSTINDSAVIAILDTGIDTTLFVKGMRSEILWHGPDGSKNFLNGADPSKYMDDHASRHGTSVASIALNSYYQASDSTKIPKLMVVKVMDSLGQGSVFELCCGISYAAENNATVINTSMGYYGTADAVLKYYAEKCHMRSIPIVAAAGNDTLERVQGEECTENINDRNKLKDPDHLFYPGCLASESKYSVISVTGFKIPGVPCYYQNYSRDFVTMGVMNERTERNCCKYQLPFINSLLALEGSSFATPVVSGKLAFDISKMGRRLTIDEYVSMMHVVNAPTTSSRPAVTQSNQYVTY